MIPELGHFALILAACIAAALSIVPLLGAMTARTRWMLLAGNLATGQFVFVLVAFLVLAYAFAVSDFSVAYVARNSNSLLPMQFKFSAIWGAHEGSFLLWTLIMCGWTLAVAVRGRGLPLAMHARVLSVMGINTLGFLLFMLFTSNPFDRILPLAPQEGADLNPLLQDFGLIVHPPMLYMGYVGFSVPFAFAIAALMSGQLDAAWARWSRPWTNVAWAFLTVGIALGSWWAYYELGWGGWWFWDAVENASFMPWLVGTALIHSLAVTEKRGVFRSWTVLLAIFAFSLSLLGTFIVRSGVLTSVHAFAVDPERGLFILCFMLLVVGGSLLLYAVRAPVMKASASYSGLSREVMLLVNNVLLIVSMVAVLLGTLMPLIYEAATGGGKISVGPPYFNAVFVPLMAVLTLALAAGPYARWKHMTVRQFVVELWPAAVGTVVLAIVVPLLITGTVTWQLLLTVAMASWILLAHAQDLLRRARARRLPPIAHAGMTLAHIGFAVSVLGIGVTTQLSSERDVRMEVGEHVEAGGYAFRFDGVQRVTGPNYIADRGTITVSRDGREIEQLFPEKRRYMAGGNVMTEAAIDPGLFGDTYVALGEPLTQSAWSVRVHVKPLVRWVWLGGLLMALGGVLAVLDPRYRRLRQRDAEAAASAEPGLEPVSAPAPVPAGRTAT